MNPICALSTPAGAGAIAMIRVSGGGTFGIVKKIFRPKALNGKEIEPRYACFGEITDAQQRVVDEVMVTFYRAPHSYTGEDMAEISCHGSMYIVQKIMELLLENGCGFAEAGAFTQRAFLNGKMDLTQAEAVMDVINSHSDASHRLAVEQMRGGFSKEIETLRDALLNFSSLIELELDFSEEDVEFADRTQLMALLHRILSRIQELKSSFTLGNVLKNGIPIVIVGKPNVGKSTLLNVLLNEERAIVSHIPGTTRDTIEEAINIDGMTFRFIDTAGLRHSNDTIESMGIERTYHAIDKAMAVIYLFDITTTTAPEVQEMLDDFRTHIEDPDKKFIVVANKTDEISETPNHFDILVDLDTIFISAKRKENIGLLTDSLSKHFKGKMQEVGAVTSNLRHFEALSKTQEALETVQAGLTNQLPTDLVAADLRQALYHLGSITGQVTSQEILENIFGRFCIGK
ncbi:MAG: tRNA uridine-5-carboxymethylaminomethyl(34) synthesis GTPase MnmE [Bacteroidales bacterium]|nr:tRNA uridine-5-carboxymethylaminomethyl(34) synthesis GTPase MnmE [Bacteroidales bacterium]